MIAANEPIEKISRFTGLTIAQIEKIKNNRKAHVTEVAVEGGLNEGGRSARTDPENPGQQVGRRAHRSNS